MLGKSCVMVKTVEMEFFLSVGSPSLEISNKMPAVQEYLTYNLCDLAAR